MTESSIDPEALERLREWGGDRLVTQMIHIFLESTPERIEQIRQGLETGDVELLERAAHSLKSSAANLGAEHLRDLSAEMEDRAHQGEVLAAGLLLPDVAEAHARACRSLEALQRENG